MSASAPLVELVVARYAEDVRWLEQVGYPAVVYDKSDAPLPQSVVLPNMGRESHTYFSHIVARYDSLAETTVFVQGDPFFHLEEQGRAGVAELRAIIDQAVQRKVMFQGLAWFRIKCDALGRPHDMAKPASKGKWKGWGKDIPVGAVFQKIFGQTPPKQFLARGVTGNFLVRRERILTRPRSFYAHCLEIIENDPYDEMNTGHAFERLWHLVFNGNTAWNAPADKSLQQDT